MKDQNGKISSFEGKKTKKIQRKSSIQISRFFHDIPKGEKKKITRFFQVFQMRNNPNRPRDPSLLNSSLTQNSLFDKALMNPLHTNSASLTLVDHFTKRGHKFQFYDLSSRTPSLGLHYQNTILGLQ